MKLDIPMPERRNAEPAGLRVPAAQIKSRDRVRDIAEVYTRDAEIKAMLDLVGDVSHNVEARFLEPAAGNGNFLVCILDRKLAAALRKAQGPKKRKSDIQKDFEFYALQSLTSIYGVDIDPGYVQEAHERLRVSIRNMYSDVFNTLRPRAGFYDSVNYVLCRTVIQGDGAYSTGCCCAELPVIALNHVLHSPRLLTRLLKRNKCLV
jgi:hypothetical protein